MNAPKNGENKPLGKAGVGSRGRKERYPGSANGDAVKRYPVQKSVIAAEDSRPIEIIETYNYQKPKEMVRIQPGFYQEPKLKRRRANPQVEERIIIRQAPQPTESAEEVRFSVLREEEKRLDKKIKQLEKHDAVETRKVEDLERMMMNHTNNEDCTLNDLEHFALNKAYPGLGHTPYVNNTTVTPLPTGTFKIATSITQVLDVTTSTTSNLGTGTYLIIMSCPALSSFLMGTGNTAVPSPFAAGTRLGGFSALQTNSISNPISAFSFADTRYARSAIQLWGSDFSSFAQGGYVWSQSMGMHIVAPAANLTGAYYSGLVTLGQLTNGLTLQQLIQDSSRVSSGTWDVVLKSAVVNPDLVTDINYRINGATTVSQLFTGAENEIVSYVIYQTPAINITTGLQSNFTLLGDLEGNFVYYPNAQDPLAFSLGDSLNTRNYNDNLRVRASIAEHSDVAQKSVVVKPEEYKKAKKQMENLAPVAQTVNTLVEKSGWSKAKDYLQTAVKYGKIPIAIAAGFASKDPKTAMAVYEGIGQAEDALGWGEESSAVIRPGNNNLQGANFSSLTSHGQNSKVQRMVVKSDVLYRIRRLIDAQMPYSFDNIEHDCDSVNNWLNELKEFLEDYPSELIPADASAPVLDISRFLNDVSGLAPQLKRK